MIRSKLAVTLLVVLSVAGVVRAASEGYRKRLDDLYREAQANRTKLGLDKDRKKLMAQFPTPELTFDTAVRACPGETVKVRVPGKFATGTAFVVESDDVQVVKEQLTPAAWEAELKVKADLTPRQVSVSVLTPVSAASRNAQLLEIGCKYLWRVELENGEVLIVTTTWGKTSADGAEGQWTKQAAAEGTAKFNVSGGGTYFTLQRQPPQEEMTGKMNAFSAVMQSAEVKAINQRMQAAQKKMEQCSKQPPAQMGACMKAPGEELRKAAEEQKVLTDKALHSAAPKFGCDELQLDVSKGTLSGTAKECQSKELKITGGSVKAVP